MMEKLSSEIKRDDRLAGRIPMHGDPFHVVDLIGQIGLEHRPAIDQSAFLDVGERNATDADGNAPRRRCAPLKQQQLGLRKERAVADIEIVASLDAKSRYLIRTQNERAQITGAVEAVLGHHDQPTGECALPWRHEAFETLVIGERLEVGRHVDGLPRASKPSRR